MQYVESNIKINGEWKLLLVVKSDNPQTFGSLISFTENNFTYIYEVSLPLKLIFENNEYYYWFVPLSKEVVNGAKDSEIENAVSTGDLEAAYKEGVNSV
jgi:hypothetical protein|nr:MAG TPA: hypothetical protein [Caudoviricetes sp.]